MPLINFSGIASGIDTNSLIQATSNATRQTQEQPLQDTINTLTATDTDLGTLKTKFQTLQTLLQGWSTVSGGAVVKQVTSSDETLLSASASSSASDGTFSVTLQPGGKATNGVQTLTNTAAGQPPYNWNSLSALVDGGAAGTVNVTVGSPALETETLSVTATTTIGDLVTQFNSQSTHAIMSAINVGSTATPQYALSVTSNQSGVTNGTVTVTGIVGLADVTNSAGQSATDANFDVQGVATGITRGVNTVTDVLPGVNMNILNAPAVPTQVTLTVGDDVSATTSNVQDFINDWNDIVSFLAQESSITQQQSSSTGSTGQSTTTTTNVFGPLSQSSEARNGLSALRGVLAGSIASSGSQVKIMADLGITTNEDGTLAFNTQTFQQALAKEPNSVNQLLTGMADTLSKTGGTIDQFAAFNQIFDMTVNSNNSQISNLNDQISQIESNISQQESSQRQYYAQFEAQMGQLQSQQQQLTSALAGLGGK